MAKQYSETVVVTAPLMLLVERMRNIQGQGFEVRNEFPDGYGGVFFNMANGVTMSSWGEDISIHMWIYNNQQTMVEFVSESAMPTQLVDFGKNKKNIANIEAALFNGLNVQVVQQPNP